MRGCFKKGGISLIGSLAVAGRVLWIGVCPSFCPSVLPFGSFLGIGWLVFSETQHGVRGLCIVVHENRIFLKKLSQKLGKWVKNRGGLDLLENLVINCFWIWFVKKVHIICCILALILCLEKMWFLRWAKMVLAN